MHHERLEPEFGHGIDDGLVRVQVWIPPRSYGLLTLGVQMPDPILRKMEHDGFERWFVHAQTLPTRNGAHSCSTRLGRQHRRLFSAALL